MTKSYAAGERTAQTIAKGLNTVAQGVEISTLSAKSFFAGFKAGWKLGALRSVPSTTGLVVLVK